MAKRYIAIVGDVNFPEYDGGVVYKDERGDFHLEYAVDVSEAGVKHDIEIYGVDLIPGTFDWVTWPDVARSTGEDVATYRQVLRTNNPVALANLALDVAGHYGWANFDQYPLRMSLSEAKKRYRHVPRR